MADQLTIGLLGEPGRAVAWEGYLRPHPSVAEVVITSRSEALGPVNACIILSDKQPLQEAIKLAKSGIHVFLVGKLPLELPSLLQLLEIVEESRTVAQFSNWAYFNPVSLWMMDLMPRPRILHCSREVPPPGEHDEPGRLDTMWVEDLSLIMKWVNSGVHRFETQSVESDGIPTSRQAFLKFDNGATATFHLTISSGSPRHMRFAADNYGRLEADILSKQGVHIPGSLVNLTSPVVNKDFSGEIPAQYAITRFLKSIHMKRPSEYGIFDAVQLARTLARKK